MLSSQADKKITAMIIILLVALVLIVYWPVQHYEFNNYDDVMYVTKNYLTQKGISAESVTGAFTDISTGQWHPLTMISHMLDWHLFKDNAGAHHWTSVIIHMFNAILLFIFLHMTTGALWRSALVAALFAVHPVNVDSVAWIAERKNVLSTFFWILTMLIYFWYVNKPSWKRYIPLMMCFFLGLMSKAMLVTLPFVLLLMDYWPLKRAKISMYNEKSEESGNTEIKREKISLLIIEKIPMLALSMISAIITIYTVSSVKSVTSMEAITVFKRFSNAIVSYTLYIKKMFWPFDLAVFYPFNHTIPYWHIILATLFIITVTFFVCRYFREYPYLAVGWFWYLGTLLPVIGIIHVGAQSMADRWAYVPFIGIFIMLIWGVSEIIEEKVSIKIKVVIFAMPIIALVFIAHQQVKTWENSYTLWQQAIKVTRENFLPHKNLGLYLTEQGRYEEAIYHLKKAMELNKKEVGLHNSIGVALARMGETVQAIEEYKKALLYQPTNARAHNNIGVALMRIGKINEAEKHFREAIRLELGYPQSHYFLAEILKKKGLKAEADYHYKEAMRLNKNIGRWK